MPNHICHVITTISRGGAENQLLTLARRQILNGDSVSVIFLKGTPDLLCAFQESGANVIDILAGKSFFKQIQIFSKLILPPRTIVHAHLPRAELLCYLSRKGNSYLISRHNSEAFFPKAPTKFSSYLSRKVIRNASQAIAISDAVKNFIIRSGEIYPQDLEKLTVIYYGAVSEFQGKKARVKQVNETIILGTAARLTEQKDIPTLIRGFKIILLTYPRARLRIAGEGPLKSELMDFSTKLGVNEKIDWLGTVANMSHFYSGIDCFVLASKYEGFGLVLLEALGYGLPIVATRTTSIPEVLGETGGLLFEVGNPYELANCVRRLIGTSNTPRIKLDPHSALEKFSIQTCASRVNSVYETVAV